MRPWWRSDRNVIDGSKTARPKRKVTATNVRSLTRSHSLPIPPTAPSRVSHSTPLPRPRRPRRRPQRADYLRDFQRIYSEGSGGERGGRSPARSAPLTWAPKQRVNNTPVQPHGFLPPACILPPYRQDLIAMAEDCDASLKPNTVASTPKAR